MNISESFATLLSRIQPTTGEISAAQGHIATIKTRLNATFTLNRSLWAEALPAERSSVAIVT